MFGMARVAISEAAPEAGHFGGEPMPQSRHPGPGVSGQGNRRAG